MANCLKSSLSVGYSLGSRALICNGKLLQEARRINLQRNYCCHNVPKNVGFIGLGNMGSHMASHLINKGFSLTVYDVSKEATDAIVQKGAKAVGSSSDVASSGADCIVTMLPNNDIVLNVYCGENGLISKAKKGAFLIDSSTVDPSVAKEISAEAESKGVLFVDAPVSGGVIGAKNATLTFMVGGKEEYFQKATPYLQPMGGKLTHCGPIGAGLVAKICNNMLLAISMIGVSECMNLGIRLGLDPKVLMDIVNSSTGRCWSSEVNNPVPGLVSTCPASNDYKGGFSSQLICKDLGLATAIATKSHTPIQLGSLSQQIYQTLVTKDLGNKDFSVIYDFLQNKK